MACPVAAQEPLSAIDWLSRSVEIQLQSSLPGNVTVEPLRALPRAIGFVPPASVGLSAALWSGSESADLIDLLGRMPADAPLPLRDALATLVTVEAVAEDTDQGFTLARIDTLLALGRLDAARRLAEEAGLDDPAMFRRAFDIALLTGQEDAECRRLRSRPGVAATYPARIFCFARLGDWQAAALTLRSAETLAVLTPDEVAILGRFLNDGEEDALPPPERPASITPLVFRLYEAIGAPLSTRSLPLAFAHADLRHQNGWKTRIEAAERLYRAGAIPAETLLALYLERDPAASGGVWDRVAAVQSWHSAPATDRKNAADAAAEVLAPAGLERVLGGEAPSERAWLLGSDSAPDPDLADLIEQGRSGEAALLAILRAADAWEGDPDDRSRALATIDAVGLTLSGPGETPQWAASR
jgi:hypothetical protein